MKTWGKLHPTVGLKVFSIEIWRFWGPALDWTNPYHIFCGVSKNSQFIAIIVCPCWFFAPIIFHSIASFCGQIPIASDVMPILISEFSGVSWYIICLCLLVCHLDPYASPHCHLRLYHVIPLSPHFRSVTQAQKHKEHAERSLKLLIRAQAAAKERHLKWIETGICWIHACVEQCWKYHTFGDTRNIFKKWIYIYIYRN